MNRFGYHSLFRVEAGPSVGLGHLSRCLALAKGLGRKEHRCGFVMTLPQKEVRARIRSNGFAVLERNHFLNQGSHEDAFELAGLVARTGAEWLVVDGYGFRSGYFKALRSRSQALILAIDDFQGRVEADLILNQNLAVDPDVYKEARAELLIGPRYCLLDPPEIKRKARTRSNLPAKILVTLGGADPQGLTQRVVQALSRLPGLEVDVVIGPFSQEPDLGQKDTTNRFHFHRSLPDLSWLIREADLGIMSLGVTTWEMAYLGLPFVMLPIHPAQVPTALWLADKGYAELGMDLDMDPGMDLGNFQESRFSAVVQDLLNDPKKLRQRSKALLKLVDGRGAARVAARMKKARRMAA